MSHGPLQNRVAPTGAIVADPGRGLLMGNRGCLHRSDRTLGTARWRSPHWICCTLSWKGVRREPMPPGRWTALFFLDEATALAAGHRPCAFCRRADFNAFAGAWRRAMHLDEAPHAPEIDARLHAERVDPRTRTQATWRGTARTLPDGAMMRVGRTPGLVLRGSFLPWSFEGYGTPVTMPPTGSVEILTPPSTVAAVAAGYRPLLHPSAGGAVSGK